MNERANDMSSQSIEALMERVAAAERSAQAARAEVAALRDALTRGPRGRSRVGVFAMALVLLIAFGEVWRVAYAQGGFGVIQAPLIVRGKSGVIFSVVEGENANQATLFDRGGNGVAMMGAAREGGMFLAAGLDGETRAGLGVENGGGGGLSLFDASNQPLASINQFDSLSGLTVYDTNGNPKAAVGAAGDKPLVLLNSNTQSPATALFVDTNDSGLAIVDPAVGTPIVHLGLQTPAAPSADGTLSPAREGLTVFSSSGKPIVRAFRNPAGNGSVSVIDQNDEQQGAVLGVAPEGPVVVMRTAGGAQRAALGVLGGKAAIELRNAAGKGIAQITEGPGSAGQLGLGNSNGDTVVEAGTLENGNGLVRVYPWRATTPGMLLGMPGTYIVGHRMGGGQ